MSCPQCVYPLKTFPCLNTNNKDHLLYRTSFRKRKSTRSRIFTPVSTVFFPRPRKRYRDEEIFLENEKGYNQIASPQQFSWEMLKETFTKWPTCSFSFPTWRYFFFGHFALALGNFKFLLFHSMVTRSRIVTVFRSWNFMHLFIVFFCCCCPVGVWTRVQMSTSRCVVMTNFYSHPFGITN